MQNAVPKQVTTISIHVPTWGTTEHPQVSRGSFLFQSTFPRGERLRARNKAGAESLFQSTFPRGERRKTTHNRHPPQDFNPRSHVGNDPGLCLSHTILKISIHVPTWGTTGSVVVYLPAINYFNPRSHVGNDPWN